MEEPLVRNDEPQLSAVRISAAQLRKKRVEELRVRNEELQLNQRTEDQRRAEQIAAKFETNSDELRITRMEQRLDLLQKLDQKRWAIIQESKLAVKEESEAAETSNDRTTQPVADGDSIEHESDSEVELDFVGQPSKPKAVSLLELTDRSTPRKLQANPKFSNLRARLSPGRGMNARDALRNKLVAKRRKMGNLWLARELGYQTEGEHLRDCIQEEERKRKQILKLEEVRLRANDRKQLRERLLEASGDPAAADGDEPASGDEDNAAIDSDDEEERAMARELESESRSEHVPCRSMTLNENGTDSATTATILSPSSDQETDSATGAVSDPFGHEGKPSDEDKVDDTDRIDEKSCESVQNEREISSETSPKSPKDESRGTNSPKVSSRPKNIAWKAMLEKEAQLHQKLKKRRGGLIEDEADEEEEEDVPGLEDFGFTVVKKAKQDDDEEEDAADKVDDDDLNNVVDDLSDNEGDEEAGEKARREMESKEEKKRHKEIMQRMKNGYDGRRGGLAVGRAGARGKHSFDELVAADNREDAKRLGLLNDDELDSDEEGGKETSGGCDEDEDEAALLNKMLKDRFLHRSSVELEENFSDDDDDDPCNDQQLDGTGDGQQENAEEKEQERQAKRFARLARMHRLIEAHGHAEGFSQSKLIDDDAAIKLELQNMKNGLVRKRNQSSALSSSLTSTILGEKRQKTTTVSFAGGLLNSKGSLAAALQASTRTKHRTTFVRSGAVASTETTASLRKSITFSHVVFKSSENSQPSRGSQSNFTTSSKSAPNEGDRDLAPAISSLGASSLWSRVAGFQKER